MTAESRADGTRAERTVKRKHARRDLGQGDAAVDAGEVLTEHQQLAVHNLHIDDTAARAQCRLKRIREAALHPCAHDETVDDHLDGMFLLLFKCDFLAEVAHFAVDADAHIAVAAHLVKDLAVLALFPSHELRHDEQLRPLGQNFNLIHHLIDALLCDGLAAARAVRTPHARIEQAQVVVDLRDRADRRARIVACGLLIDRNRGRQSFYIIDIGLVHLPEKLPRIGGQRLDVAALPLGVDRVERERGFPRAGEPRHDDEFVARNFDIDILEVMGACALYFNAFVHIFPYFSLEVRPPIRQSYRAVPPPAQIRGRATPAAFRAGDS